MKYIKLYEDLHVAGYNEGSYKDGDYAIIFNRNYDPYTFQVITSNDILVQIVGRKIKKIVKCI